MLDLSNTANAVMFGFIMMVAIVSFGTILFMGIRAFTDRYPRRARIPKIKPGKIVKDVDKTVKAINKKLKEQEENNGMLTDEISRLHDEIAKRDTRLLEQEEEIASLKEPTATVDEKGEINETTSTTKTEKANGVVSLDGM